MKRIIPILVLILVLGIVSISGCTSSDTSNSGLNYSSDNITHPEAKNVTVLNSKGYSNGNGYYIINGTVKNKNSFGVSFIKLAVTCYDKDGNIVTTDWAYVENTDIPSQGQSKFSFYINDPNNKITKYNIKILDADKSLYTTPTANTSTTTTSTSNSGSSSSPGTGSSHSPSKTSGSYIANANTGVFHYSWCHYVNRMNEENKVLFTSREAAINAGYRPCKVCDP